MLTCFRTYLSLWLSVVLLTGSIPFTSAAQTAAPAQVELSLAEAIQRALENNLDIRIERYNINIGAEDIQQAEAAFDRTLTVGVSPGFTRSSNNNAAQTTVSASVGFEQTLKSGISYEIALQTKTSDYKDELATSHSDSLSLTVSQPLLKNRGKEITLAKITTAEKRQELNVSNLRSQVASIVSQVITSYWGLLQARGVLEADQYALQLAQDQMKSTEAKIEVGMLPRMDILQAQATAASRQVQILSDQQQVRNSENELKQLLNVAETDPLWNAEILPGTAPDTSAPTLTLEDAIRFALDHREELQRQRKNLEIQEIALATARNQLRPELNLQGSVGLSAANEEWLSAWGDMLDLTSSTVGVGVNFKYPIGNRDAKSNLNQATLSYDQAMLSLQKLEQQITTAVKQAMLAVETSYQQIDASHIALQLAEEQLKAEQGKFEEGLSTNYQVLNYQEQLASAQSNHTKAIVSYNKALVTLQGALGNVLAQYNIVIDDTGMTP